MSQLSIVGDFYTNENIASGCQHSNLIINLEGAVGSGAAPADNKICLSFDAPTLERNLRLLRPKLVTLANNHIYDYGELGLEATLRILDNVGIPYVGLKEKPHHIFSDTFVFGKKVRITNICCESTNPRVGTKGPMMRSEEAAFFHVPSNQYYDILICHMGDEEIAYSKPADIRWVNELKDRYDLVVGHHGHVIQNSITTNGNTHYLGIGNFLFDDLYVEVVSAEEKKYVYKKIQRARNKKSLLIEVNEDGVVCRSLYNGILRRFSYFRPNLKPHLSDVVYSIRGKIYIFQIKIRNFLRDPSLLSVERLKRVIDDLCD